MNKVETNKVKTMQDMGRAIRERDLMQVKIRNKAHVPDMIFEYIKRRRGGRTYKIGIIMGVASDQKVKVSWSKCNLDAEEKFDLGTGQTIAFERAIGVQPLPPAPLCIQSQVRQFGARCIRYFKNSKQIELPIG